MARLAPKVIIDPARFLIARADHSLPLGDEAIPFEHLAFDGDRAAIGQAITDTVFMLPRGGINAPPKLLTYRFHRTFEDPPMFLMMRRTTKATADIPNAWAPPRVFGYDDRDTSYIREVHSSVFVDRIQFSNYFTAAEGRVEIKLRALI